MGEFGGVRHEIYLLNFLAEMKVVLVKKKKWCSDLDGTHVDKSC